MTIAWLQLTGYWLRLQCAHWWASFVALVWVDWQTCWRIRWSSTTETFPTSHRVQVSVCIHMHMFALEQLFMQRLWPWLLGGKRGKNQAKFPGVYFVWFMGYQSGTYVRVGISWQIIWVETSELHHVKKTFLNTWCVLAWVIYLREPTAFDHTLITITLFVCAHSFRLLFNQCMDMLDGLCLGLWKEGHVSACKAASISMRDTPSKRYKHHCSFAVVLSDKQLFLKIMESTMTF